MPDRDQIQIARMHILAVQHCESFLISVYIRVSSPPTLALTIFAVIDLSHI